MHSSSGLLTLPSPFPSPLPSAPSPPLPLQVDNNYRLEVKVLKKYHGHLIGKGGANLQKVSMQCGVGWVWVSVCACLREFLSMACKCLPVAMATLTVLLCVHKYVICTHGRQTSGQASSEQTLGSRIPPLSAAPLFLMPPSLPLPVGLSQEGC